MCQPDANPNGIRRNEPLTISPHGGSSLGGNPYGTSIDQQQRRREVVQGIGGSAVPRRPTATNGVTPSSLRIRPEGLEVEDSAASSPFYILPKQKTIGLNVTEPSGQTGAQTRNL